MSRLTPFDAEIEYKYSEASIDAIMQLLGPDLAKAVRASHQYKWERETGRGLTTTDCVTGLSPKNRGDITLQLLVGLVEGTAIIEALEMQAV